MEGLVLLYTGKDQKNWFDGFYYGVEEEGVPVFSINVDEEEDLSLGTAFEMAEFAAQHSVFDIGLGADAHEIILRHRQQKDGEPLLKCTKDDDPQTIRVLGTNAARMIKRLPLILDSDSL